MNTLNKLLLLAIAILLVLIGSSCASFHPEIAPPKILYFSAEGVQGGVKLEVIVNESTRVIGIRAAKLNGKGKSHTKIFERKENDSTTVNFIFKDTGGTYEVIVTAVNDRGSLTNTYHLNYTPKKIWDSLKT